MTQKSHLLPSDFGLNSCQELIYQPPHRAGDHLDDLDAFRDALLTDLAPMRPHEAVMAENIIMIEWDISQILIQKRHIARSAVFDEITNQYVKLAEDEVYEEERRQRLEDKEQNNDFFASICICLTVSSNKFSFFVLCIIYLIFNYYLKLLNEDSMKGLENTMD